MAHWILPARQAGFGLLEALVALVILAFGLLGMAGLQLHALKTATQGYQRSVATLAAIDAQERLWSALAASPHGHCSGLSAKVNDDWQTAWFADSQTPIAALSGQLNSAGCTFEIEVILNDGEPAYSYTFHLPNLSGI
jgi:type IV pilus assembly protein PilV